MKVLWDRLFSSLLVTFPNVCSVPSVDRLFCCGDGSLRTPLYTVLRNLDGFTQSLSSFFDD